MSIARASAIDTKQPLKNNPFRERYAHSVGAGVPANTGAAGARLGVEFFAGAIRDPVKFALAPDHFAGLAMMWATEGRKSPHIRLLA